MSYENPAMPQGGSPINKYFDAQSRSEALAQKEKQRQDILKRQKEKERQANINRMQEMQYKVDMLSLQRADELGKITENPTLDNEVTGILRNRIDVASQAQLYLMTDFSDNKKRAEAKKVIADYQNLLNLTQGFASSWSDITAYWNEKKDTLGSQIAVFGTDNYSQEQNQWLINVMAGKIPGSNISLKYDETDNDLKLVVSGKNGNGDVMPTRTISAKKWMELDDSEDNDFIQEVPQVFQEFSKKLGPGPDGFNLLTAKGILDPKYIDGDDISIDIGSVYSADGKTKTGTKQDIRTYYDLKVPLSQMNAAAVGEISGVAGMGYNAMKNFYEVNLKMNNNIKGNIFPNEYKDFVTMVEGVYNNDEKSPNYNPFGMKGRVDSKGVPITFVNAQEEILSRVLVDQAIETTGLKVGKDEDGNNTYYTSKINVAAIQKKSSSSGPNPNEIANNALAVQFNNAIADGQLDDLNLINGISIERVPGSSKRYYVKGKQTSTGNQADYGTLDIPSGDLYSDGASKLRRLLGLPEQYNLKPDGYVTTPTNTNATNDIVNFLKPLTDDSGVDGIDELTVNFKGDEITFAELKEKVPGLDIINHYDALSSKITIKLPLQNPKTGEKYAEKFSMPLSPEDRKEISTQLTKALLKF